MRYLIFPLLLFFVGGLNAQNTSDLFMHKELKEAYEQGFRSYSGEPGPKYYVNRADYDIIAEFNPDTRQLKGQEFIHYTNNSPDTLKMLVFNLYQDLYRKGNARDWDMGNNDLTDGVQIKKMFIGDNKIELDAPHYRNYMSIMSVQLPEPLLPGESVQTDIEWEFTVADTVSIRQGMYGEGNFFIAYWYPKIAVYDDIVGWDMHGHTGRTEFYNDFGDYTVEIKLPAEYTIWSGGVLQNADEILNKDFLKRYEKAHVSEEVVHIVTQDDRENNRAVQKKAESHTWKFKFENTPDFSFALSKSYLWDGIKANNGERDIFVQAAYKAESENFAEVCQITKDIVEYYSKTLPGIPFPYPQATAFNGGGGMEFPGMVNDTEVSTRDHTLYLTAHEFGHSYFPFASGLDEQKYAWMDEGLISFFPRHFVHEFSHTEDAGYLQQLVKQYADHAGEFNDVPLAVPSENTGRYGYRFHAYTRPGTAFYVLEQELGSETFFEALQLFFERWEGKHPKSFDFFYTFNEVAGQDLAWFWKPWFFEFGYPDICISEMKGNTLVIKRKGNMPVPVRITAYYADGDKKELFLHASVWKNGETETEVDFPKGEIVKVESDTTHLPDINPEDNIWEKQPND